MGNVHGGKGCVGGGSHVGSWGHELEPASRAWSRVEALGAMEGHGAMSHGCQGVEGIGAMGGSGGGRERAERAGMHWDPFFRVGAMKGCMGGGRRAGRAEWAGMRWGPLKSSDRGMGAGGGGLGSRGHGKSAWGEGGAGGHARGPLKSSDRDP